MSSTDTEVYRQTAEDWIGSLEAEVDRRRVFEDAARVAFNAALPRELHVFRRQLVDARNARLRAENNLLDALRAIAETTVGGMAA